MRVDDPADSSLWPDLSERIENLRIRFQTTRELTERRKAGLNRIKYHASRIARGPDKQAEWQVIIDAATELIHEGLPASNLELRQLLLPIVDCLPDVEMSQEFQLVLDEIDRYLATRSEQSAAKINVGSTPEVIKCAKLLSGKAVVLIGGDRRPRVHAALKSALGVGRLDWIDTVRTDSVVTFEPNIARPDVAVVILAIRWARHSYGEVTQYCVKHGKPLVRLPAGYNVNQVAFHLPRNLMIIFGWMRRWHVR